LEKKCGIVLFTAEGKEPSELKEFLAGRKINVSVSKMTSTRLDMESRSLESIVRASLHYFNTQDEINRFCHELKNKV